MPLGGNGFMPLARKVYDLHRLTSISQSLVKTDWNTVRLSEDSAVVSIECMCAGAVRSTDPERKHLLFSNCQ